MDTRHGSNPRKRSRVAAMIAALTVVAAMLAAAAPARGDLRSDARDETWSQDTPGIASGVAVNENFGRAVALGDFDGDGFDDMAVGAPGNLGARGSVHVIRGTATGLTATGDQYIRQGVGGVGGAQEPNDRFGQVLAVGNFNGDAYDDLAIGVPFEHVGATPDVGAVHVLYGSSTGLTGAGSGFFYPGPGGGGVNNAAEANDRFGASLSTGDYDNDGADDLAIGVPLEDVGAVADAGFVHILRGGPGGITVVNQIGIDDDGFGGVETSDHFGENLESGDTNGDGIDDLVVQAGNELVGGVRSGAVTVWHGRQVLGPDPAASSVQLNLAAFGPDADNGDGFGDALAAADFNGDGLGDLAIGTPFADTATQVDGGYVHVMHGVAATPMSPVGATEFTLASAGLPTIAVGSDAFGRLATAGEFDDDPHDDLVVAYTGGSANKQVVLHGSSSGLTTSRSHLITQSSSSIASGDIDGNDAGDLAIGDPFANVGGAASAGDVFVRYGERTPRCRGELATVQLGLGDEPTSDADVIVGTDGDDEVRALGGGDLICTLGGDDDIRGNAGNDTIFAGSGADTVRGGGGEDFVQGNAGDDMIWGNSKSDTLKGGKGDDTIKGGKRGDVIRGQSGHDTVIGNGGHDALFGNSGRDDIEGGKGNDTLRGGKAADALDGGAGTDDCKGGSGPDILVNCNP